MSRFGHDPRSRRRVLVTYAAAVATAVGGGVVAGRAVGPINSLGGHPGMAGRRPTAHSTRPVEEPAAPGTADSGDRVTEDPVVLPGGLAVAQAGYRLQPQTTVVSGRGGEVFRFRLTGPDGLDVAASDAQQSEPGLVLVSRALDSYRRMYPNRELDGSWAVALPDLVAGVHRIYAELAPVGGPELTLGVDVMVPGDARFAPLPAAGTAAVVDGYEVTFEGTIRPATPSEVRFSVTRGGVPVGDLPPWFGPRGHLVAVRVGDLALTRADPVEAMTASGVAAFVLELPSAGDYRLFYEFVQGDQVHVAAFSVNTTDAPATGDPAGGESLPTEDG